MEMKFEEKQRFTQWWLWVLLLVITCIPAYGIYKQILLGEQFGNNPITNLGLIILMLLMLAFIGLFWMMELRTRIDHEKIEIHFFPFAKKEIKWKDIAEAEVTNYGFAGGWGIRSGTKHGTVYNIKGEMGLAIQLKNGTKLCIGTQKEDQLRQTIKEASRNTHS